MGADVIPPLPPGFVLDDEAPPLPAGFTLDQPATRPSSLVDRLLGAGKFALDASPIGLGIKAGQKVQKTLDRAAYDAGGLVTDATGSPGLGLAANVAVQAVPAVLGGEVSKLASPTLQSTARDLMQSALKPTWASLRTGKAATAIQTMLDDGINVSSGGVAKLRSKIGELNREIMQAIVTSPATVDKGKAASVLFDTVRKFEKQVAPGADVNAINRVWNEFLSHPLLTGRQDMPVQLAQELKQGTYRALGNKSYGELKGAEVEAQKALARGLKDEIATAVPAVRALNAEESRLLTTLDVAERRVLMDANKNPAGLGWLAAHPSTWAAFLADRSPLFKSLVARMVYSGSEQIPATAGRAAGATAGAYTGRTEQ